MFRLRLAVVLKMLLKINKIPVLYSSWVFVDLGAIFGIFETCPKCSLGSPEKVGLVSGKTHVSFEIGSNFENVVENQ